MKNEIRAAVAAICSLAAFPALAANYYWTGAVSGNWNSTDANWAVGSASGAAAAWSAGNVAVFPDGAAARRIEVSGSVSCSGITVLGGDWTVSGGGSLEIAPTTDAGIQGATAAVPALRFADGLSVVFKGTKRPRIDIAALVLENATMDASSCTDGLLLIGYQSRGLTVVTVGDGAKFTAKQLAIGAGTAAADAEKYRIDVLSGGVLQYATLHGNNATRHGTIRADGGTVLVAGTDNGAFLPSGSMADWSSTTHLQVGAAGWLWAAPSFRAWQPMESALPEGEIDGGIVIDRTGLAYLRGEPDSGSPENSFTGGVTAKQGVTIIANDDRNFGAVPETARVNIAFAAPAWFAILAEGKVELEPARTIVIDPGANLRLCANGTAGGRRLAVRGAIVGTDPEANPNGVVHSQHASWIGDVALEPAEGVESEFGRLIVKDVDLTHGGEGTTTLTYSTASVENGSAALVVSNATLTVSGGTLRVAPPEGLPNRYTANYGTVAVTGGTLDLSRQGEYLNAFRVPGTTVVERAGTLLVNQFRLGEGGQTGDTALLRLGEGGTLVVSNFFMNVRSGELSSGGRIDWDGGVMAPVAANTSDWLGVPNSNSGRASWLANVQVRALEGGAVVSNNVEMRIRQPIVSGAANDGGFAKWGTGMLVFVGDGTEAAPFNSFNGPVTVHQGTLTMGSAWNFPGTGALRVAEGATFNANNSEQAFAVIGGSGRILNPSRLRVTEAIEPGFGGETGTLTVSRTSDNSPDFASVAGAALRIDAAEDGSSVDKLHVLGQLDLSQLTLEVSGAERLDPDAPSGTYVIAEAEGGVTGSFRAAAVPQTWTYLVRRNSFVELRPVRPFVLVVR